MIDIELQNIGKRFFKEWIFSEISVNIPSGQKLAILGANGAGKSTLLKIMSGFMLPTTGKVNYHRQGKVVQQDTIFENLAVAAPYVSLIEEFTLAEMVNFHFKFKPLLSELTLDAFFERSTLKKAKNKPIRYFSSGMKMRAKLMLAIASDASILLLDEPTSNLDKDGVGWYQQLIEDFGGNRTILVGSNDEREYSFCTEKLQLEFFKKKPSNGKA